MGPPLTGIRVRGCGHDGTGRLCSVVGRPPAAHAHRGPDRQHQGSSEGTARRLGLHDGTHAGALASLSPFPRRSTPTSIEPRRGERRAMRLRVARSTRRPTGGAGSPGRRARAPRPAADLGAAELSPCRGLLGGWEGKPAPRRWVRREPRASWRRGADHVPTRPPFLAACLRFAGRNLKRGWPRTARRAEAGEGSCRACGGGRGCGRRERAV